MDREQRIGPRMAELCRILAQRGGTAPSQRVVYMELIYNGGSSNRYGSAVMDRAQRAGLIRARWRGVGLPVPVELTDAGWAVALEVAS